jgi:hypothetical protein
VSVIAGLGEYRRKGSSNITVVMEYLVATPSCEEMIVETESNRLFITS